MNLFVHSSFLINLLILDVIILRIKMKQNRNGSRRLCMEWQALVIRSVITLLISRNF